MNHIPIAILAYPGCLLSAVHGLEEMLWMANRACAELDQPFQFDCHVLRWPLDATTHNDVPYAVVVLPPSRERGFDVKAPVELTDWLHTHHQQGAILASACAGVFLLADTGLLAHKVITTHWGLAELFQQRHPELQLNTNDILINQGDIITAGGMMSWIDLGLELIAQFASPAVMRQVGKLLVVDTGLREQRYYQQFTPSFLHGDESIVALQHLIHRQFAAPLTLWQLAEHANVTERTVQRRFLKATGLNPIQYLQRVRIQKACDWLESTAQPFEWIAHQIGYEDVSACRKVFIKIMGLTPSEFRRRFAPSHYTVDTVVQGD